MLKYRTEKVVQVQDWDRLVKETYAENPNGFEKTEAGGAILNFSSTELSNGNEW